MPKSAPKYAFTNPGKLIPVPDLSHGKLLSGNLLIQGDNLPVLQRLQATHGEKVQCIYIDPPYNTGHAFAHYDDALSHQAWLEMMRPRLTAMQQLLQPSGIIYCSIGDAEMAYLKILLDEIFGRRNYVGTLIWEKKKKPSFLAHLGTVTEYILVYAKDKTAAAPLYHGATTAGKKYPINNAGNGVRILKFPAGSVEFGLTDQLITPRDMSGGRIITRLLDPVEIRGGRNLKAFRLEGEWRYAQKKLSALVAVGERIHISKVPFRPNHIRKGGEPKKMKNLLSTAHYGMATYEDAAIESRALFGELAAFAYPKPEQLIHTLINAVTQPGDWVLDAFLGSGTTAAVAQKSGRRWIGIEAGEHAVSLCAPRLRKVCQGKDALGISPALNWQGGGGFSFLRHKA
ncbi:MAG TPA: site-specific DNA-methyltransferase [Bacteroidetes bacterium]|nr:site-specific DNA-methyltransferase [Bacteroidota bacterium]